MFGGDIVRKYIEENFSEIYTHFKEFQENKEYVPYWQKSISVSMNEYFKIKTATYFIKSEV